MPILKILRAFAIANALFLFFYVGKSLKDFPVPFHPFVPHGKGAYPRFPIAVKRTVNYVRFARFRVLGKAEYFVFLAFKMTVFSKFDFAVHINNR